MQQYDSNVGPCVMVEPSTDGTSLSHQNIIRRIIATSSTPRANDYPTRYNSNTSVSPTPPTHANKVMMALSECVKAIKGLTGQVKTSQEAMDLHD